MIIKIQDRETHTILDEYDTEASATDSLQLLYEKIYEKLCYYESLGLDVKLDSPSIMQSLCDSLGVKDERLQCFQQSVEEEWSHHD